MKRDRDRLTCLRSELRSEEHTSELQSRLHLVCRLLLEKKKKHDQTLAVDDIALTIPHAVYYFLVGHTSAREIPLHRVIAGHEAQTTGGVSPGLGAGCVR